MVATVSFQGKVWWTRVHMVNAEQLNIHHRG